MSQIGYMFLGAGLGAYANGMFHLMTHAFFKALLFMAAGLVIHALAGEQDIRKMGGLRGLMPRTYLAFLVGALALVGLPPFAGFFSKDSILAAAMHDGWYGYLLWAAGLVGTFLTGLYTFRMLFVVFGGEPSGFVREHLIRARRAGHAHHGEGPFSMTSTVAILAVLSVIGGWVQFAPLWIPVTHWLDVVAPTLRHAEATSWQEAISSALAFGLGLAGLVTAWLVYSRRRLAAPRFAFAQRVLEHKFYFDEGYDLVFYRPAVGTARLFGALVERLVVGGSIAGLARGTRDVARGVAEAQTGLLRTYALAIAGGLAVLVVVFISVSR
jgi:NADH-quinone oxidoreductase subunit L